MEVQCQVCGTLYEESELTLATTTYSKQGEDLKVVTKLFCDFCLYQEPAYVKVFGDGSVVEPDPDDEIEEDITGDDEGTVEVGEDDE